MSKLICTQTSELSEVSKLDAYPFVIGLDEAGWGPVAGPMMVCATVLPPGIRIPPYIRDSKTIKGSTLDKAYAWVRCHALLVKVDVTSALNFHSYGPSSCRLSAFTSALREAESLYPTAAKVIDGTIGVGLGNTFCLPKADTLIPACSAASIVAKYKRDRYMREVHKLYPEFGFDQHKGYGTVKHNLAIEKYGRTQEHRMNIKRIARAKIYGT